MVKHSLVSYLIDGGSRQNTQYILSQIDGGLDTSIPDHYSPELADFVDRLLSTEVRLLVLVYHSYYLHVLTARCCFSL
jgi:hypothetical protein